MFTLTKEKCAEWGQQGARFISGEEHDSFICTHIHVVMFRSLGEHTTASGKEEVAASHLHPLSTKQAFAPLYK
jgi:hypothetical protein